MKIVFFNDISKQVDEIIESKKITIKDNQYEGKDIEYDDGSFGGCKASFIVLDDIVEFGEILTDEIIALDKSNECLPDNVKEKNALEEELKTMRETINFLLGL